MPATNLYDPNFRFPKGVGHKVYAFQFGATTTPVSTYADPDGSSQNPWPVVLADAGNGTDEDNPGDGIAPIYVSQNVTIDIRDADDVSQPGYPAHFVRGVSLADLQAVDDRLGGRLDTHDDDLFLLQSRATLLEGRATDLENRATALESRVDTAEDDIDALEGRAGALEGRMTTAESDIDTVEGRASTLEGRATTVEGRADALESRMGTAESDIDTLQGQLGTANSNISNLQGRMGTAESDIDTLQSDVSALQSAVSGVTAAVGASNYSWDKESDTLHCWGTAATAANGVALIAFPTSYDASPTVVTTCIWSGAAFVVAKLTSVTTANFIVFAGIIDITKANNVNGTTVNFHWSAIGKKAG